MRLLPRAVLNEAIDELECVALEDLDIHQQSVAAFQLSFALVCGLDTRPRAVTDLALSMLLHSAKTGYDQAQAIVGWMYEAFEQQFPILQEVEEEWLYRAINKGFPTARRRLRKLNLARYEEAVSELRRANGGIGENPFQGRWPDAEELDFAYIPLWKSGAMRVQPCLLHYLASTGLSEALQLVLDQLELDVNEPDPQAATPLCLACRSGHLGVVEILLSRGADPTIADKQGTTPLHWLSSFRADELGEVIKLLLQHGANIEARARQTRRYVREDDITSHRGRHGGTPLLWAVADANLPAVQALLDVGADPWDKTGKELLGSNNWGEVTHLSPIHFAARGHMYEILRLLLPEPDESEALNADYRTLGSGSLAFAMLPLGWAVCYGGFGSFEAILWHGNAYKAACERTIQLLLDRGANPKRVTSRGHSAVELATQWGQAFMVEFLGRTLRGDQVPTGDDIRICLSNALLQEDTAIFDALMSGYFEANKGHRNDPALLDHAARNSDNSHFMVSLLEHFTEVTQPIGTTVFEMAIRRGNYSVARLLHDRGLFDPTCTERFIFSDSTIKKGSPTVLGAFILNSTFSNMSARAVRFILSLLEDEDPDSPQPQPAFWAGPPGDQRMSALHLAALVPELRRDLTKGTEVMNELLAKFHEPYHLNATAMPSLRFTPLHLAVYLANVHAIDVLLDEEGVDPSLTDEQGRTPMDLALFRVFETTDEETMGHILAWLSQGTRESAAEMRRNNSVKVISQLMRRRLRTVKYASVITKESELSVNVITPNNEPPTNADDKDSRLTQIKMPTDEAQTARMRQFPFLRKLIDMPVGGAAILRTFESEEAAAAAGHSTGDLHQMDGAMALLQIRDSFPEGSP
ncbi:hypothetical protein GP486_004168 [Trichoglossum hirsutum]|uniref:protein S-acyltransferase n=1 Tax=Trichoglossum hirsutum TaxID=265104 RepID=A0A9P8RQ52_9PEZI|nr:hypothetical protein GP486_004168 [Trichoglossum hirsutum]